MLGFTGTLRLVRLALRRDRVKLPIWIVALTAVFASNVPAVTAFYGKTMQDQVAYAASMAPSLAGRIFGGPLSGPELGAIVLNETFLFTAIAVIFMSTLAVVRHTRQNEETGRSELIGSAVVGRNASLGAALIVAIGANVILAALIALSMIAADLPVDGSVATAAALAVLGISFAGIAAVTAQLSESARGANSLAAAILGVAFILRAFGDAMGSVRDSGLGINSSWPSFVSPLGWAQQIHPFTDQNWWLFGVFTAFIAAVFALAFYFNDRRDLGLGMLPARKGPARAPKALLSPLGLASRLQRGILRGWAVGMVVMGGMVGLVSKEFAKLFEENDEAKQYLEQLGGNGGFEDVFFAAMIALTAILLAGYAIQALQRLRSEEAGGQLEAILATGVSRSKWMLSHISYMAGGVVILLLVLGVSSALTFIIVTDAQMSQLWRITGATLTQLPPVLAIAGLAVAAFGLFPRLMIAFSWTAFGLCLLISQFAAVLKLPQYVVNISPFTHLASAPAEPVKYLPLAILTGVALVLLAIGIVSFRRRDISTA
jgi:ABC-2 type transport system permease protein